MKTPGRRSGGLIAHVVVAAMFGTTTLQLAHGAERAASAERAANSHPTRAFWLDLSGAPAARSATGAEPSVRPQRFRSASLDLGSLAALAAAAPAEGSAAARQNPVVVSLPDPDGGFQRFAIVDSPVMEPALAAKHPEIRTYAGQGIDDPRASLRMDVTPMGFHASVRAPKGQWYIDPYYHLDPSLYVSYHGRDLRNPHGPRLENMLAEPQLLLSRGLYHAGDTVQVRGIGFPAGAQVAITVRHTGMDAAPRQTLYAVAGPDGRVTATLVADPYRNLGSYDIAATDGNASASATYQVVGDKASTNAASGSQLRTYRLALLTDPAYANYFGASNVTAAKVSLINRVTQVYESETSIRLVLIGNNDALNLDTAAQFSGANGPCGGTACFATPSVSCVSSTLTRTRQVIGLLVGASSFDIGHIAVGAGGGGIASLGVVGTGNKAQGCTGLPTPVGDLFAVDYVAHEMGHQFAGNHTFNGTIGACSGGNRNASTSVEPGSGSSIMAYAGICGTDDLQPHSDPYWSQRSFDEVVTYTSAAESTISEVQMGALTNFNASGESFQLTYNGSASQPVTFGVDYTANGLKAAIEAIPGWPQGGTVQVSGLTDTGFTLTFGGTLAGVNVSNLQLVNCVGCSGYVGEIAKGGTTSRGGIVTASGNTAPVVSTRASYTIPLRTPFALTGSGADADGNALTYMWEQTDPGTGAGTALLSNTKLNGPLFRQFGTRAVVSETDTLVYNSPGENRVTADPTRIFPDMAQILANNTNAETGSCPTAATPPTAAQIDCYSEFLPTAAYTGSGGALHFRLTARDGRGGVNNAATTLTLATTAGPFLVTSPNAAVTLDSGSTQSVTWDVANTQAAPVSASQVAISLSADGGSTFPYELAVTPNDGAQSIVLPNIGTTRARIKVAAVDNVFFDVSNADFVIKLLGDLNGDNSVDCSDLAIVKASFGKRTGQTGFDPRADVVVDGVVNAKDLAYVTQRIPARTTCATP